MNSDYPTRPLHAVDHRERQQRYAEAMHPETAGAVTSRELRRIDAAIATADAEISKFVTTGHTALANENARLRAELDDWRHNIGVRSFTTPDADLDTVLESLDARIRDANDQAEQPPAGPICTAVLTAHRTTWCCTQPAGHYDDAREPTWPDHGRAANPGGWHSSTPQPDEAARIWSDRAAGATPHQEQP
ncbi:hypothetical protein [Streptomyces sp. Amel2xB2]|uniref:hypothetical protein n=1 Tax=Streptomyces sp. Amel2xB2 TaxID=1305829 RepID=UPI000DBA5C28|nr:hypothetical protein [Streptomyces sp. Amel2xB2]